MGPWNPHHPFPDRGAALRHPNSNSDEIVLAISFSFFTVKETRQGTKHVVAMWTGCSAGTQKLCTS